MAFDLPLIQPTGHCFHGYSGERAYAAECRFFQPHAAGKQRRDTADYQFRPTKRVRWMYVGNGDGRTVATLTGFNVAGGIVCRAIYQGLPTR